jgi:hypothetical protein
MSTLYWFKTGADANWTTLAGNWWTDTAQTAQAGALPVSGTTCVLLAGSPVPPSVPLDTWVAPTSIAGNPAFASVAGTGVNNVPVVGNPSFASGHNAAHITGNPVFNGASTNAAGGLVTGNPAFNGTSQNAGTVTGNPVFAGTSSNSTVGLVTGNPTFTVGSSNAGAIAGNALFQDNAYNAPTALIQGNAQFTVNSYMISPVTGRVQFFGNAFIQGAPIHIGVDAFGFPGMGNA